jgi:competence protein ComEC
MVPAVQKPLLGATGSIAAAAGLLAIVLINKRACLAVLALLSGLIIGAYRADAVLQNFGLYEPFYGQWVQAQGTVSEDTTITSGGGQRIKLTGVAIDSQPMAGQIWLEADSAADIKRSDIITVEGLLGEGFGSFQASISRANLQGVTKIDHSDVAREVRDWFADGVKRVISEPEASLGIGYLTGQRNTLPEQLDDNLRLLGLTHIVVASGFNLTILVRFARRLFAKISKYLATAVSSVMMFGFILVTGFSPSMSRAGIVTGLSLLAWYFGRKIHPFVLLPVAAAITVLLSPSFIWGDIGWYLSFAAFGGVIILAPLLRHFFFGTQKPGNIKQILVETTSAQIATMPILAYVFGQYSPLAVPANLLILPLVSVAMAVTFVAGAAAVSPVPFAVAFGWPAQGILDYMTTTVDKLAALPFAEGEISFGLPALAASYAALALAMVFLWRRTGHDFKQDSIVE